MLRINSMMVFDPNAIAQTIVTTAAIDAMIVHQSGEDTTAAGKDIRAPLLKTKGNLRILLLDCPFDHLSPEPFRYRGGAPNVFS